MLLHTFVLTSSRGTPAGGRKIILVHVLALLVVLFGSHNAGATTTAQTRERTFPETGKMVRDRFLEYWETHGGIYQQGYPIADEFEEVSDTDGKTYVVQYFERAVFEYHPENKEPYDVLLQLLGVETYKQKYGSAGAPNQVPNRGGMSVAFAGNYVGGQFLEFWSRSGGIAQLGFPISNEFREVSALDGKEYTVQYFERAVLELHPENRPPYDILLSQLGTLRYKEKYGSTPPPTSTKAALQRVVDGDTIEVKVGGQTKAVRYLGIDAPDLASTGRAAQCYAEEARRLHEDLFKNAKTNMVTLTQERSNIDDQGRLLRHVKLEGIVLNIVLVEKGAARASANGQDTLYRRQIEQAQKNAQQAMEGLWGPPCNGRLLTSLFQNLYTAPR